MKLRYLAAALMLAMTIPLSGCLALVAGGAANTTAAIELVRKLTGLTAMNLLSKASHEPLNQLLVRKLGIA